MRPPLTLPARPLLMRPVPPQRRPPTLGLPARGLSETEGAVFGWGEGERGRESEIRCLAVGWRLSADVVMLGSLPRTRAGTRLCQNHKGRSYNLDLALPTTRECRRRRLAPAVRPAWLNPPPPTSSRPSWWPCAGWAAPARRPSGRCRRRRAPPARPRPPAAPWWPPARASAWSAGRTGRWQCCCPRPRSSAPFFLSRLPTRPGAFPPGRPGQPPCAVSAWSPRAPPRRLTPPPPLPRQRAPAPLSPRRPPARARLHRRWLLSGRAVAVADAAGQLRGGGPVGRHPLRPCPARAPRPGHGRAAAAGRHRGAAARVRAAVGVAPGGSRALRRRRSGPLA